MRGLDYNVQLDGQAKETDGFAFFMMRPAVSERELLQIVNRVGRYNEPYAFFIWTKVPNLVSISTIVADQVDLLAQNVDL